MVWQQAAVCFFLWIGAGWLMQRRTASLRGWLGRKSRIAKLLLGSIGLVGSAAMLLGGLLLLGENGGIQNGSLTLWAWAIVAVLGTVFIVMQVLGAGAILLLSVRETSFQSRPSEQRSKPKESQP